MSAGPGSFTPGAPPSNPALEQEIQKKATTAIIAAIVGFACCALVQIYTLMVSNDVLKQIEQTGAGQQHKTLATVAKVIAIVNLVLVALAILLQIVFMVIGIGAGAVGN